MENYKTGKSNEGENNIQQQKSDSDQIKHTSTEHSHPVQIIIADDKRKDNNPLVANIISAGTLFLSVFAFWFTYLLFKETLKANETSKESVEIAKRQFEQSIVDNEEANKEQSRRNAEEATKNRKQFKLDSAKTQAQIQSLKEMQKQFEITTKPLLQITNLNIDTIKLDTMKLNTKSIDIRDSIRMFSTIGVPHQLRFFVSNIGQYPAKILTCWVYFGYASEEDIRKLIENDSLRIGRRDIPINHFVVNTISFSQIVHRQGGLFNDYPLLFAGEYIYENPENGKRYKYRFAYQITKNFNDLESSLVVNDNKLLN